MKVETQVENWAGGADGMGRLELRSVAINGNGREKALTVAKALAGGQKARNSRNFDMASRQDDGSEAGFFGRHSLEGRAWTGMGHAVLCKNSLRRGLTVQGVNSTMCI